MILTAENYHSVEANQEYMSNSQFGNFTKCEAMAMATLDGDWESESTGPMMQGSYVHAWNESKLEQFKARHPELYKNDGNLYAKYSDMDDIIEVIKNDPKFMDALSGKKEVIFTAELFGAKWRIMIDSYKPENSRFGDLKVLAGLSGSRFKVYNEEFNIYQNVFEAYGYYRQVAIYSEIERLANKRETYFEPFLAIATKEKYPDKAIVSFVCDMYGTKATDLYQSLVEFIQLELKYVSEKMPRILKVKAGEIKPMRCEVCDYCKSTKMLTGTTHFTQFQL